MEQNQQGERGIDEAEILPQEDQQQEESDV